MNACAVVLLLSVLLPAQPDPLPSGAGSSVSTQTQGIRANASQPPALPFGAGEAITLLVLSLTWATLTIQLFILPFYGKGELLHKDYWANGKINSTLAAIEAGRLIPALARMFKLAVDDQEDKRRRPEREMEELLQRVEFLPDLKKAQDAVGAMDALRRRYERLRFTASMLWMIGLVHMIATPTVPIVQLFLVPVSSRWQWLLVLIAVVWVASLALCVWGLARFHKQIDGFNRALEIDSAESE